MQLDLKKFIEFEFVLEESTYKGKIFIPQGPIPNLGDDIIVTIKRTAFNLTKEQVSDWLKCFGTFLGELEYKSIDGLPMFKEDTLEVLMKLNQHIPSILPAYGKRLYSQYRGQPILCSSCFVLGHVRKNCPNTRKNWEEYVKSVYATGKYAPKLFGDWKQIFNL